MLQNLCKSRALPLFLVLGLVFLTPGLRAQNPAPACDLAGTWYGGGDTAKYLMTVTPAQGGDYTTVAQGAFSSETLGFPVSTQYSGSIVKGAKKAYEAFSIGLMNDTTSFPAPTPQIFAVHSSVYFLDCNTLRFDYNFFGAYFWPTDKEPFVSQPDYVVVPPPFSETYRRMPTTPPAS